MHELSRPTDYIPPASQTVNPQSMITSWHSDQLTQTGHMCHQEIHLCNACSWQCAHCCADAPRAGEVNADAAEQPPSLAVDVIELLSAVLAQSPSNRRTMQQISGESPSTGQKSRVSLILEHGAVAI